jgi:hypothetical protein
MAKSMTPPHIRVFPHSPEEFSSIDSLTTWLMTGLKARGGIYHMRSARSVKELPEGSIVLFRYGHKVVGEAVVSSYIKEPSPDKTIDGGEVTYEARTTFEPTSIRIFSPPVPIEDLQQIVGAEPNMVPSAQPYFKLENWGVYPNLLALVVTRGGFL